MPSFEQKVCERAELAARMAQLPAPVVLTNGVFDILHRGHVTYLAQARALGASLVVAVNTDASVRRLGKGDDRPINACADRMAVLAALEAVSLVVAFDEDTATAVVNEGRPQIYAKGGDYVMTAIPEGQAVLAYGGQATAIDFQHDRSTTRLLSKVRGGTASGNTANDSTTNDNTTLGAAVGTAVSTAVSAEVNTRDNATAEGRTEKS